ncbi:CHAT domain-containing protein [Flavisolibacter ginsengisoli]|jgi:CHAT domain-containing protein|uniref:CHAT domain-containing protein n=1 Tax=Flavisolibacter ginsengisoli DSM 18119 TaxID=1121884 RepID=A0A1M5BU06_9BACT|nr:CHAT domain-containing tetratricopeptide repeat protein [Flavisolibacter ginsengisoli]SHF45831.1 CHAT domain-containing protein [Flavisolibacter ginsengisoli DSM 18119]
MKFVYCLLSCVFLFLLLHCFSQAGNLPPSILAQYQKANRYYNEALQYSADDKKEARLNQLALQEFLSLLFHIRKKKSTADTVEFFSCLKIGELESYFDSTENALKYYNQALGMQSGLPFLPDSFFFKSYLFAGLIYYQQSQADSAASYFKKAEAIHDQYPQQLLESERLYNLLGAIYYESGNYYQAKNYFLKAAEALSKSHSFYKGLYVNYQINLATVLFKLEEYDTASKIYQQLLPYHIYQNEIYNNIGLIHLYTHQPQKAIEYFSKVQYSNFLQLGLLNDMARACLDLKNYPAAMNYLRRAIDQNGVYYKNNRNKHLGRSYQLMGDLHKESGKYPEALSYYQQACNQLYPSFRDTSIHALPQQFSGVFSYIDLFQVLVAKAETWHLRYLQSLNLEYAEEELKTYRSAFALVAYVERTYDSDQARLFLGKIKYAIHSRPIEMAYELYTKTRNKKYAEALYQFDQQNKATVLAFNQEFSALAQHSNLPVLKEVQDLKRKITALSIKANQMTDSLDLARTTTTIRNLEIELGKKQEELAKKIHLPVSNVQPVSDQQAKVLDDETAIVSYTLSEDRLTKTVITKDSFTCYQDTLPPVFHQQLQSYIQSLLTPSGTFAMGTSKALYTYLIKGIDSKVKHLVFIPDNELCYLPFESLIDQQGKYLIENHSIQYQYSTNLLKRSGAAFSHHQTLSFVPFASRAGQAFGRLPNSLSEVSGLRGEKFIDTAATKENFIRHLQDHRVVHLATHAVVNNRENNFSYIVFSGADSTQSRLYAGEIYNLPLKNTDLVILSACETGAGNFIKGEGVMSLSRAFSYAGCSNIITTLWKADDYSTAYLSNKVHGYLDEGLSIDKALQQAKLDYLADKKINPRLKTPYYWSHLVFVGDVAESRSFAWNWVIIAIAIGLFILLILAIKRSRAGGSRFS